MPVMEIKHNEATRNRPEGNRVIDAPYVFANLPAFIEQVKDEHAWKKNDRNAITVFKTNGMTIVLSALKDGAMIKNNTINGLLTVQVLKGLIRIKTPEWDIEMRENELITFHPGFQHTMEAITDTVLLITTFDTNKRSRNKNVKKGL
jgi:quercetin dioxygenase-like cupin family protein